jgi:hypothetical protein
VTVADDPSVTIRFPTGVLFDVMMRGGPLPARYATLGGQLMRPGPLAFTAEEAIAIRDWLALQPEGFIDLRDRVGAIAGIDSALRIEKLCTTCGAPLDPTEILQSHCGHCSA